MTISLSHVILFSSATKPLKQTKVTTALFSISPKPGKHIYSLQYFQFFITMCSVWKLNEVFFFFLYQQWWAPKRRRTQQCAIFPALHLRSPLLPESPFWTTRNRRKKITTVSKHVHFYLSIFIHFPSCFNFSIDQIYDGWPDRFRRFKEGIK